MLNHTSLDDKIYNNLQNIIQHQNANKEYFLKFLTNITSDCILDEMQTLTKQVYDRKGRYLQTWKTINKVLEIVLSTSSDSNVNNTIFDTLKSLGKEIEHVKKGLDLPEGDLEILQNLTNKHKQSVPVKLDTQIKSLFHKSDDAENNFASNPTWAHRARLDVMQLQQRALVCEDIQQSVFEHLNALTKDLKQQERRLAPIKDMTRAVVKLLEYIEERKNTGEAISSSTYDAKDLMRMSQVCTDAEETRAIFKALTNKTQSFRKSKNYH